MPINKVNKKIKYLSDLNGVLTELIGGTGGAQSQWDCGDHAVDKAFVDNPRIGWCSSRGLPVAIWKLFHQPVKVLRITFQARRDQLWHIPTKFDIYGSSHIDCNNVSY